MKNEWTLAYIHVTATCGQANEISRIAHGDYVHHTIPHEVEFNLNEEIVRWGYGFANMKYNFSFKKEFRELQQEAIDSKRGLSFLFRKERI